MHLCMRSANIYIYAFLIMFSIKVNKSPFFIMLFCVRTYNSKVHISQYNYRVGYPLSRRRRLCRGGIHDCRHRVLTFMKRSNLYFIDALSDVLHRAINHFVVKQYNSFRRRIFIVVIWKINLSFDYLKPLLHLWRSYKLRRELCGCNLDFYAQWPNKVYCKL